MYWFRQIWLKELSSLNLSWTSSQRSKDDEERGILHQGIIINFFTVRGLMPLSHISLGDHLGLRNKTP